MHNIQPDTTAQMYRFETFLHIIWPKLDSKTYDTSKAEDLRRAFYQMIKCSEAYFTEDEVPDGEWGVLFQLASGWGQICGLKLEHTLYKHKSCGRNLMQKPKKCFICKGEKDLDEDHMKEHPYVVYVLYGCHSAFEKDKGRLTLNNSSISDAATAKLVEQQQVRVYKAHNAAS